MAENSKIELAHLEVLIEKQRNGPTGKVCLTHHRPTFAVCDIST